MARNETDVLGAFDLILDEMQTDIEITTQQSRKAFRDKHYESTIRFAKQATDKTRLHDEIERIYQKWRDDFSLIDPSKRKRESRTRWQRFRRPILQILCDEGGTASRARVFERIPEYMTLKDIDYEPTPSEPKNPRWYSSVDWTKYKLKELQCIRDEVTGIWEITEIGVRLLQKKDKDLFEKP